jgi:ribose-phosphate pyrophosphokinase
VRSKDVFIVQSTCTPVNENLVELLLMVSTMRRASAKKITVVIPYYGYARQDRKTAPRVPISAADVARLLETVGVDRVVLVDVHSGQIQGFFGPRVPVDNLEANLVAMNYFVEQKTIPMKNIVVISPDAGGVTRAKNFQNLLSSVGVRETSLAMIIKQRKRAGEIGAMHLVGSV